MTAKDNIITIMSAAANGVPPIARKIKPFPSIKSFPPMSISSPAYMAAVTAIAAAAGIHTDSALDFLYRMQPRYVPNVTPKTIKNKHIRMAETGETRMSPVR